MARETLLLVDGHNLVYRAFHAMPALSNSRGEMTNAAYGFTSMLFKALNDTTPTYAIAAFDPPGPTFRHEKFEEYKAQRLRAPDELRAQFPWAREVVVALGIPIVEIPTFEADDVIGTLAQKAEAAGLDVIIVTGDLDVLQLVTEHIRVFASRRGISDTIIYDLDKVRERYGFEPPLVVDFKALQGDPSDNIPGVPGIGEKTAMSLVQQYGPLENVLEAVPTMPEGRVRRALESHMEQARLSKWTATIKVDVDVGLPLEEARLFHYDEGDVRELFDRLEFRSLLPRLPGRSVDADAPPSGLAVGRRKRRRHLPATCNYRVPRWRSSSTRIRPPKQCSGFEQPGRWRCARFSTAAREPAISSASRSRRRGRTPRTTCRCGTRAWSATPMPPRSRRWRRCSSTAPIPKRGYDLKRELLAWRRRGIAIQGLQFDALLAAYLTNSGLKVPTLPVLAHDLVALSVEAEETLLGSGRSKRGIADVPIDEAAAYYGVWVGLLDPVGAVLVRDMERTNATRLHDTMELPLVPILAAMEVEGVAVDCDLLGAISAEMHQRITAIESEVQEVAGYTFNPGSTQQLGRFLYDDLGLASGRKTKTGRSTDADTLEALRGEHAVVDLILEWRQLTKLKSTYVDALPLLCTADSRVHTSFNQAVATTGRLSSSDPNLQNIPVRTQWGQRIRRAFHADAEQRLISADYSQVELRVLAHVTGEKELIEAFKRGEDIHRRTAAEVYAVEPDAVTPDMRRIAKVVNFGVVYGLSDFGLARDTGMSREDAHVFIDAYFRNFPAVTAYLESVRNHAREYGWVETFIGRRRYIADIRAANRQLRFAAERMAVNMPIQGGAADIMKQAMILVDEALRERGLRSRILLQVHDELLLEAPAEEVDELVVLLRERMGAAEALKVPLDVDVKVGDNWGDMTPIARN